jgi:flagellar protein FlbD
MIALHRLGHQVEEFHLNPDLIITIEANPDTVIVLTTGAKVVVAEPLERVVAKVRRHRVEILAAAMARRDEQREEFAGGARRPVPLRAAPDRAPAIEPAERPAAHRSL